MQLRYTAIVLFLLLILIPNQSEAQCSTTPCTTPVPSVDATQACILPAPTSLDCYYGSTTPDLPISFPPSWCTVINNNHWFAFTADAASASFDISCYGCASGNGIQAAVLSTADCVNFAFVSPCLGNIATQTTQILVASPLTPGNVYYLCIDGSGGALCDYSINGSVPTVIGTTSGVCIPSNPTGTYSTSAVSSWSINPPSAGTINGNPISKMITVTWNVAGGAEVCARNAMCPDAPEFCLPVNVGEDILTTEDVNLCQGKTVECGGKVFSSGGTFQVKLKTYLNCDSLINCVVHVIPKVFTTETHFVCQNQSVTCAGVEFGNGGTFPITLTGNNGCDSVVNCKIIVIPTTVSPFKIVNLCGPASYTLCTETYNSSGLYTQVCTSSKGCDSIVNVNLAILEPNAVIAPPGILDCTINVQITLDGSGSSVNTAVGGQTFYKWTGPGIVGVSNASKVKVNQPGTYCLVLTHSRGGLACADTTCVNVTAISSVPQLPLLGGNLLPCQDSTTLYTATPVGSPAPTSYTWTTPGSTPFTTIAANIIQIPWTGSTTGGPICVIANNSCGSSQPACITVAVQPALQIPVMTGPTTVCAGGGTYLYTLNGEQAGTTYTWSVPAGATFTGSGDSVLVNFLNSVSGPVCVSPQNFCGTGASVCKNVTVQPIPSAKLTGGGSICDGDSIKLKFTLTGNGPFDVNWFDGSSNVTLNDIPNGYTLTLAPIVNTNYQLNGIVDNTTPTACTALAFDAVSAAVHPNIAQSKAVQLCDGQTLLVGGAVQTKSGVYVDSLQTTFGCDSIITTTLTVYSIDSLKINLTTCDPAQSGTNTVIYKQTNGCDSIVTTVVKLLPSNTTLQSATSCDLAKVGVFTKKLTNIYGCDSTVIRTVTFSLSDTTLLFNGNCDPAAVGTFIKNLLTTEGCDSVVITKVSLLPKDTTYLFDASCNPNLVGVFKNILTNQYGCDSTIIRTVTFFALDTTFLFGTSCNLSKVGTFVNHITTLAGCDSIITTTISFIPLDTTFLTTTTCLPASAGVFAKTLITSGGCDSVVVTTVNLLPSNTTLLSGKSCNPGQVGVFTQNLKNKFGCDSTVITTITFFNLDSTFLSATTCDPAAVGTFQKILKTSGGCDSVVITNVTLLPSNTTLLSGSSCNPAEVGVFTKKLTNKYGCDSTVITTISFFHLDTTYISDASCDPGSVGVFQKIVKTPAGCDQVIITTVSLLPKSQFAYQTTTCKPAEAGVFVSVFPNQYGCDSTVTHTVKLLPSSTKLLQYTTCDPLQVGSVVKVLTNYVGCDSTVTSVTTLLPASSCGVTASLTGSTIPCGQTKGSLTLTPTLGDVPFNYDVRLNGVSVKSGTLNAVNVPAVINNLDPGNYTVVVSSSNGFSITEQSSIVQLFPPALSAAVITDFGGFSVSCKGELDGSARATATGGKQPFSYTWSNGATGVQANDLSIGSYSVTVTDANQCTNTASVSLTEPTALSFNFSVSDLTCFGTNNGRIYVDAQGGVPPYRYTFDNIKFQTSNVFTGLKAGQYSVTTFDANDCQRTEIIIVNPAVQVTVDLGNNHIIALGDSDTLHAIVNVPIDSILSITWTPSFVNPDCDACLDQIVTPFISTTYSVKVVATNGCSDDDKVVVTVNRRKYVYVPNAFNPDKDDANNKFSIFAKLGTVKNIKSFQIFDRWGEMVYTMANFQPNNPEIGWDGRSKGNTYAPGVFVWYAEVEFIDGVIELYKGDVTVVR
jgi:gliding motility-associated-like protein